MLLRNYKTSCRKPHATAPQVLPPTTRCDWRKAHIVWRIDFRPGAKKHSEGLRISADGSDVQ